MTGEGVISGALAGTLGPPEPVFELLESKLRPPRVRDALRRSGCVDVLGEDNLASSVDYALQAVEAGAPSAR